MCDNMPIGADLDSNAPFNEQDEIEIDFDAIYDDWRNEKEMNKD